MPRRRASAAAPVSPALTLALLLVAAPACGGSSPAGPGPSGGGASVTLSRDSVFLLTGDTARLTAAVRDADGHPVSDPTISWSSSAPGVATVSPMGLITVLAPGVATITASANGASDASTVVAHAGSGARVPGMESYDRIIPALMAKWGIPGGAVAVVKDGRLVFARGYGYADTAAHEVVRPDALFRIASVSKPITSATILSLVQSGALSLDDRPFAMLTDIPALPGAIEDPRLDSITVRQILYHAGGWDRDVSGDPMFMSWTIAEATGTTPPASTEAIIRYMRGRPLDFAPGTRYAYSNFGYAVLGRVIEHVTGEPYESYVKTHVLAPMGITRMRIGGSRLADRAEGEVHYYDPGTTASVFSGEGTVRWPDGGFYLEAMDAHGGWIASTIDLLRFLTHIDPRTATTPFLSAATVSTMLAHPPAPLWMGADAWYAMGWMVRPPGGDANWWHDGSLPGTSTLLVRAYNGLAWAALFNARASTATSSFSAELDAALWTAAGGVTAWPSGDLFGAYP
ncbi:MAG: serine hydrolase [Gemmatimonadaceae bacterium]|nr:serine hydrolase [Gemmatimonadaceae bacterium]